MAYLQLPEVEMPSINMNCSTASFLIQNQLANIKIYWTIKIETKKFILNKKNQTFLPIYYKANETPYVANFEPASLKWRRNWSVIPNDRLG
jgi:hypothetical protein